MLFLGWFVGIPACICFTVRGTSALVFGALSLKIWMPEFYPFGSLVFVFRISPECGFCSVL